MSGVVEGYRAGAGRGEDVLHCRFEFGVSLVVSVGIERFSYAVNDDSTRMDSADLRHSKEKDPPPPLLSLVHDGGEVSFLLQQAP